MDKQKFALTYYFPIGNQINYFKIIPYEKLLKKYFVSVDYWKWSFTYISVPTTYGTYLLRDQEKGDFN